MSIGCLAWSAIVCAAWKEMLEPRLLIIPHCITINHRYCILPDYSNFLHYLLEIASIMPGWYSSL